MRSSGSASTAAEQRLAEVLASRPAVTVARRVIADAAEAARWRMHGWSSPARSRAVSTEPGRPDGKSVIAELTSAYWTKGSQAFLPAMRVPPSLLSGYPDVPALPP
jgi:hypothetical protein